MKKHMIWTSDINLDEWEDGLREECEYLEKDFDEMDIYEQYAMASDINWDYLDDERMNLNISVPNGIIAIADIGRWNGRVTGYKEIGNNINECFQFEQDGADFYVDNHGVMHGVFYDHDGTTYAVYKAWKDNITEEQKENVLDAIYNGKCTARMIRRYTRNIGGDVAKIYGWKVSTGRKN